MTHYQNRIRAALGTGLAIMALGLGLGTGNVLALCAVLATFAAGALLFSKPAREQSDEPAAPDVATLAPQDDNAHGKRFLATVSHEMRTPLNGILGMARLLSESRLDDAQRTYVQAVRQSGEAMLSLVNDILDLAKIDTGRLDLEPVDIPLAAFCENLTELVAPRAHEKNLGIGTRLARDVPDTLVSDKARLRQVLLNLLSNAVKFTREGAVALDVALDGASVVFRIIDSGPGVPAEAATRIFNEFEQAGSAAQRGEGTGLGLAISRRLAQALGGELTLEESSNRGSVFRLALPLGRARPAAPRPRALARRSVLIVSAHNPETQALCDIIATEGGRALMTPDLETARRLAPGVDTLMVSGALACRDALSHIRAIEPSMRVIALVRPDERASLEHLKREGIDGYLIRPVRATSLIRIVAGSLNERFAADPADMAHKPEPEPDQTVSLKILLAEDNPVNALLARTLLTRRGHFVTHVEDGARAVAAVDESIRRGHAFDAVLMDLSMPVLDGQGAASTIHAAHGDKSPPLIALTAHAINEEREACMKLGFAAYLTKPVDPELLFETLEERTAQRKAAFS